MNEKADVAATKKNPAWNVIVVASLACPVLIYFFMQSLKAPGTFGTGESGLIGYFAAMLVATTICVAGLILAAIAIFFRKLVWIAIAAFLANVGALVLVLREFL